MDKPKRKEKSRSKATLEFVSPFSFEECVARLPKLLGDYLDDFHYVFRLPVMSPSVINGGISAATLDVHLHPYENQSTLISAYIHYNSVIYILILGSAIVFVGFGLFAGSVTALIAAFAFTLVYIIGILLYVRRTFSAQTEIILTIFKPIPKRRKIKPAPKLLFPKVPFEFTTPVAVNICTVRLQRLGFEYGANVQLYSEDEHRYQFHIEVPDLSFASGVLENGRETTRVSGKIGPGWKKIQTTYFPFIFFFLAAVGVSLFGENIFLAILPTAYLFFVPLLTLVLIAQSIYGWFRMLSILKQATGANLVTKQKSQF